MTAKRIVTRRGAVALTMPLAALCRIPVVFFQTAMKQMLSRQAIDGVFDEAAFARLFRWWFALDWPAFKGLFVIFGLMVIKPS